MISIQEASKIYNILIHKFGGATAIMDKNLLESALNRPFQTYDVLQLYPTVTEKSAALLESLINNLYWQLIFEEIENRIFKNVNTRDK